MSTDDVTEHHVPCVCGGGTILITTTIPDHPWAKDHQASSCYEIQCPACREVYVIRGCDVVKLSEQAAAMAAERALSNARDEFASSSAMAELKNAIVRHLEGLSSITSVYHFVTDNNLHTSSIGTFRKHWTNAHDWVARNVSIWNARAAHEAIVSLIGFDAYPAVASALDTIDNFGRVVPSVRVVRRLR